MIIEIMEQSTMFNFNSKRLIKKLLKRKKDVKAIAHADSGLALFNHGRLQDAKFQFEQALAIDPDYVLALGGLGRCYYELGEKDLALPLLKKSIENEPYYTMAHYLLGQIYYDKGEYQKALISFENALRVNVDRSETVNIYMALAASYQEIGETEKAIQAYQTVLVQEPDRKDILGLIGILYFKINDFAQAIQHLEKANLNDRSAQETLAQALWECGKKDRAVSLLQKTVELFPQEVHPHGLLGYYFLELKRFEEAVTVLKKALDLSEGAEDGIVFLGEAYTKMGLLDKAVEVYQELLKRSPDDVSLLLRIGYIYVQQNDLSRAFEFFQRAVRVAPTNAMARSALAYGFELTGNLNEALNEIEQALAIDIQDGVAHQHKGDILQALGDIEGAIAEFRQAIDLGVTEVLLNLADLYREAGDMIKARQCTEQFIAEANKSENNELVDMTNYLEEAQTMLKELE